MAGRGSISRFDSSILTFSTLPKEIEEVDPLSSDYPKWSSRNVCLQAYACLVMNFSSVLRFCYSLGKFGSVIFIPYIVFRLFFGTAIILMEIMLGRYVMENVAKTWTMCPFANGMLVCLLLTTFAAVVFNYVQLIFLLLYLSVLFRGNLPWSTCDPTWAKINCFSQGNNGTAVARCTHMYSEEYCQSLEWVTSSWQYWEYVVNETNNVQLLFLSLIFVTLAIGSVFIINYKGIKTLEKALPILVFLPLVLSSVLALATFLTPGTPVGFLQIWFFNYEYLASPQIWIIGFEDTVTSLGIGMLAIPFVSSHGKFTDDIFIDTVIVLFADAFCSLLAAVPLLSILAQLKASDDYKDKVIIEDTIDVFIWITEALTTYIYPKVLWSFIFFLEMIIFIIGTQAILALTVCEAFLGAFEEPFSYLWMSCLISLISFLFSTPFILIHCFDFYPLATSIITILFLGSITIEIFYGKRRFSDDFHFMMGEPPSLLLSLIWSNSIIVTAVFIILKLIFLIPNIPFEYVAYLYTGTPLLIYIVTAIKQFYYAQQRGKIKEIFLPNHNWGPSNAILKESRIVFNSQAVTKEFMYRQELYKKPFIKPDNFADQNIVQVI